MDIHIKTEEDLIKFISDDELKGYIFDLKSMSTILLTDMKTKKRDGYKIQFRYYHYQDYRVEIKILEDGFIESLVFLDKRTDQPFPISDIRYRVDYEHLEESWIHKSYKRIDSCRPVYIRKLNTKIEMKFNPSSIMSAGWIWIDVETKEILNIGFYKDKKYIFQLNDIKEISAELFESFKIKINDIENFSTNFPEFNESFKLVEIITL